MRRIETLLEFEMLLTIRCDHCRKSLSGIGHRYWRMKFCSVVCISAYQLRLEEDTNVKIRDLAFAHDKKAA